MICLADLPTTVYNCIRPRELGHWALCIRPRVVELLRIFVAVFRFCFLLSCSYENSDSLCYFSFAATQFRE